MAAYRVLSKEVLAGFDKYKYNAVDSSPFSQYVMHPFWDFFVKIYPKWVAPNVLTFSGFLLLVTNFILMLYYDMDFYAVSRDHPEASLIPNWVWLVCAVNTFLSHTLDGTDGKQARRTKTSSPLGELFDHGLDSWASFFLPVAMYSVFGRGEHGVDVYRVYLVLLGVNFCFIISHWEKYNTGVLFLPWGYDVSQVGMVVVYLISYFRSYEFWKFAVFGVTPAVLFEVTCYFGFLGLTLPFTLVNVYNSYKNKTGKMLNLTESIRPCISTAILFVLMLVWANYSSYDVLTKYPRLFFWVTGTTFSNIACKLIIAQMSSTRCELINWLLIPLMSIVATLCFLDLGRLELYILCGYALFVTVSHVGFGIYVVHELCDHFGINAFTIKSPAVVNGSASPRKSPRFKKAE